MKFFIETDRVLYICVEFFKMVSDSEIKLIQEIGQKLGLQYLEEGNEGNLCFVHNNSDLQDEFKQSFTNLEFQFFLKSFGRSEIRVPETLNQFWERVGEGKKV